MAQPTTALEWLAQTRTYFEMKLHHGTITEEEYKKKSNVLDKIEHQIRNS